MLASLRRLQRDPRRYLLVPLAVAAVAYLYFVASSHVAGVSWYIGGVLLAVGLLLGFRAWLLAVALSAAVFVAVGYLIPPPALVWQSGGESPPAMAIDPADAPGLVQLLAEYQLDAVVAGAASDRERVARLAAWASKRFAHSADNQPSRPDPLTILREGAAGKAFRCVEYSTVLAAAARSLGMPSRVVGLKRHDAETARYGGGHVVAEVWLRDERRWLMADGQWSAIVEAEGRGLSAVEVRQALATRAAGLRVVPAEGPLPKEWYYLPWLSPYLYYFDYALDQRFFVDEGQRLPGRVILVPAGAPEPKAFAGRPLPAEVIYLRDPAAFYAAPE